MKLSDVDPAKTYSVNQASEATGEPVWSIRRMIRAGILPGFKQPGQRTFRIKGEDVLRVANGTLDGAHVPQSAA
ncbi:helix-turn-helix domain-containing protein [Ruegeria lacuscaerulensis]|uniref:helix-turn-helix domain-containing protein n=1 Tax=Ruegeria lacuscaerulensis TaxID=55218 RepID=UPI00147A87A5|nr:helix-turn-helix domain-containing protein [Ruegeria lacuscaerulensis]